MEEEISFEERNSSLRLKEKLPPDKIREIERRLKYENYDEFTDFINKLDLNYKSISQIKQIISHSTPSLAFSWGSMLVDDSRLSSLIIGGLFLIKSEIWKRDVEYAIRIINQYSGYNEWRVRAISVQLLSTCVIKNYSSFINLFKEYVNSSSPHLRRVSISSAQEIAVYKGKVDFLDLNFMDILTPYLNETDPYVTSVSLESFGNFIKNHSELFYKWLANKMELVKDAHGKASILYIMSNNHATKHIKESCNVIDYYIRDKDDIVKRARSAALRNLAKYHSKSISSYLESRMSIPNAVDHWSELEIDGLLESFI